jgi:hypothetical protein
VGHPAFAAGPTSTLPDLSAEHEFDGIDLSQSARFWEKWHLITVRYRVDNGEQRFVYANDLAYEAMKSGRKIYPDGAMFGKVAFISQKDDAFPSSLEPKTFTRVQLMKKDAANYAKSNGWGYGLYAMGTGVPYSTAKATVTACHACHQIVPNRDYVFSQSSFFTAKTSAADPSTFYSRFLKKNLAQLDEKSKQALVDFHLNENSPLKLLAMPLFPGSLNESIAPLIEYVRSDHLPFLLIDEENGLFIAASPAPVNKASCPNEIRLVRILSIHKSIHSAHTDKTEDHQEINRGTACAEKVNWDPAEKLKTK